MGSKNSRADRMICPFFMCIRKEFMSWKKDALRVSSSLLGASPFATLRVRRRRFAAARSRSLGAVAAWRFWALRARAYAAFYPPLVRFASVPPLGLQRRPSNQRMRRFHALRFASGARLSRGRRLSPSPPLRFASL